MTLFVCIESYAPSEHDINETKQNERQNERQIQHMKTTRMHICKRIIWKRWSPSSKRKEQEGDEWKEKTMTTKTTATTTNGMEMNSMI